MTTIIGECRGPASSSVSGRLTALGQVLVRVREWPWRCRGEPNGYLQPAVGEGVRLEVAVVSGHDRGDDGQPEPDALTVGDSLVEAGEGFEQRRHLRLGDQRPGIGDREVGLAMVGAGLDLYRAGGHVVADGVVHEVGDEALDKDAVAEGRGRRQVGFDDDVGGSRGELVWSIASCAAASRSTSSRVVRPRSDRARVRRPSMIASDWSRASRTRPSDRLEPFGGPGGLGHGHVDQGAHGGERRP